MPSSPKTVHLAWAASPTYYYPEKEDGVLNIMVDHHNYSGPDGVREIRSSLAEFAGEMAKDRPQIRFQQAGRAAVRVAGLVEINPLEPYEPQLYDRKGILSQKRAENTGEATSSWSRSLNP